MVKIDWRRFGITFGVTLAVFFAIAYMVFDDPQLGVRQALRGSVYWSLLIYWVTGVFRREPNRRKPPAKGD
jgi:hypothetical protein